MNKKHVFITLIGACVMVLMCLAPKGYNLIKDTIARHKLEAAYTEYVSGNTTFYDNTSINGIDVAGLDSKGALDKVVNDFESKSLTITNPWNDTKDELSYKSLNLDYSGLEAFVKASYDTRGISQEEFAAGTHERKLEYDLSHDVDIRRADLSGISVVDKYNEIPSSDAALSFDYKSGKLSVIDEVYGNILKDGVFVTKLSEAVSEGDSTLSFDKEDYIPPVVVSTDESFMEKKEAIEKYLKKTVELSLCGSSVTIGTDDISSFIDVDSEDGLSHDAMKAYIKGVSARFNTYDSARLFATSTGETVTIPGGDYGWLVDDAGTVEALTEALRSDKNTVRLEAVYKVKGQRPAGNEISDTYVEVSLRDQKIWMYKEGELIVFDDCTTGMMEDPECHTNCGMFSLTYKTRDRVLRGPTWEDFVYFWMPFDGSIGMHDATWRTEEEFGGTNRFGNGSHGCVNLRLATAEIIYNNMESDIPIIIWE
ncbi:MAG: peptidoglycan binding domain-containing protein [Lachnospiraceae bacterium]|nr:peptidoglycan binding domain-containing protein [Lachnospiraceae bacterium]